MSHETNPLLSTALGPLAAEFAVLIRAYPPLLQRLAGSSIADFHIIGLRAYGAPDLDATFARHLTETAPRVLLREALPDHAPELAAGLRRMGRVLAPRRQYHRLNDLLKTSLAPQLLESANITASTLDKYEAIARLDPLVAAAHRALCGSGDAEALHSWIATLRYFGLLAPSEEESLSRVKERGLGAWIWRRLCRGGAPQHARKTVEGFEQICTVAALRECGFRLKNCLSREVRYAMLLLSGEGLFFHQSQPKGSVVFCLERVADELWALSEIEAGEGKMVADHQRDEILIALRASGLKVLPSSPSCAARALGFSFGW